MRTARLHVVEAAGIRAVLDLDLGQLALFEVIRGDRRISPYARVPWAEGPQDPGRFPPDMSPHLRAMSGDFFCAPFCADDVDGGPFHGWPGNSAWDLIDETRVGGTVTTRFRLRHRVAGAVLDKVWQVRDGHPFLYQRHEFAGGTAAINLAHHAMVDLASGGHLRFSPLLQVETFPGGPDAGTSVLTYPAQGTLTAFPGRHGPVDLSRYPIGQNHVDVAMVVDQPGQGFGWTTALRPAHADVAVLIKWAATLPQTMLWFSNGGSRQAPWCGQHVGVLGIEQGCTFGFSGRAASVAPNRLSDQGIPTAIDLTRAPVVTVSTALGAMPTAAQDGLDIDVAEDHVRLADGTTAPFNAAWVRQGPMLAIH